MGLFSIKKTDRRKWNCKLCDQEFSIADIGAVLKEGQVTKLASGKRDGVVSEKDEVFCNECSQGNLPKDQQIRLAEFAKKLLDDKHDTIALAEVIDVLTYLETFTTRLKTYSPFFNERIEPFESYMEYMLKIYALPELKQQISNLIKNEQYDEAKALCDQGTHWACLMKEKGTWEHDLNKIELLIKLSKSTAGQEKVIEAPQKTVFAKAQQESEKFDCILCKSKIEKPIIGIINRDQELFIFTGGTQPKVVKSTDDVICAACAPKYLSAVEWRDFDMEGKHPTVDNLRYFERLWNAKGPDGIIEAKKPITNKPPPSNAVRYDWVSLNKDKYLDLKLTCPKCFNQQSLVSSKSYEGETAGIVGLLEMYMSWPQKLPWTCTSCKESFTILK